MRINPTMPGDINALTILCDECDDQLDDVFDEHDIKFRCFLFCILIRTIMVNKLPDSLKSLVIQQWLQGIPRDTIAIRIGISAGAVTGTVEDWRHALGSTTGAELRELAVSLKKVGINPAQCASGFRVAAMMTKLGALEENFEPFMSDIHNHCRDQEVKPENIATCLTYLFELSKTVPFSKMSDYIQLKTNEKERLEQKVDELNDQKWELIKSIDELNTRHFIALEQANTASDNLRWYSELKEELGKNGIPVEDISQLAKMVNGIRQYGYNTENVLNEFSGMESLKAQCQGYLGSLASLKNQYNSLNRECSFLQQRVSSYNQSLSKYHEIEAMGFGLKELKKLAYTIREIAGANNISFEFAIQKFFNDIDEHYDDKLGLQSKVDKLKVEVNRLNQEYNRLSAELSLFPRIGPTLLRLLQAGIKEKDIMSITELLNTAKKLTQQVEELRDEAASLETQKQDPNTSNLETSSTSDHSKQNLDVVVSEDTIPKELEPLIRAAKGLPVNLPEFKASVMEAVKVIIVNRRNQQIK
jgi:hypothetical protein